MMCLQLPAVNKPSQHPGPHWLGWLRVAPRALHSIPPPSSIAIFSPLIFHSYSFFFFPFLPLFSLFLFAVLFSFLFGVLSSFLPLTHLHIPHQPSILFTCFSLCICVYLTFWEPLHCMPIHIAPLLVVLVYRPAYTCISHNCDTRYNCLFLSPALKECTGCQHHPPVAAPLFALGFWWISRSPVVRASPRCPVCEVSLSGLKPRNEEQRESHGPEGWVRTLLWRINTAHKCLVAPRCVIWQTHSWGNTLCGLLRSQQWTQ